MNDERLKLDLLDDDDPFEIVTQAAHLFKHAPLGIPDIYEVYESDPIFYPAKPPADWLMVSEVAGDVLVVPIAKPNESDPRLCRPIGCYPASLELKNTYLRDREEGGK